MQEDMLGSYSSLASGSRNCHPCSGHIHSQDQIPCDHCTCSNPLGCTDYIVLDKQVTS